MQDAFDHLALAAEINTFYLYFVFFVIPLISYCWLCFLVIRARFILAMPSLSPFIQQYSAPIALLHSGDSLSRNGYGVFLNLFYF